MKLNLSVVSTAFSPDVRQSARAAREAGFSGLQLDVRSPSLDLTTLSITGQRELRHVLSGQNLQISSLRQDLGNKGFGPTADIDAALARLESAMAIARPLAAPVLCVDLGPLPAPAEIPKPKPAISPDEAGFIILPAAASAAPEPSSVPTKLDVAFAASVDSALAELGHRADRYGTMLSFRSDLASFAALERAIKTANCPWFGIDLDPVAMLRDEWPMDEILSRLGGLIRHVRARDAVAGQGHRARPSAIGEGSIDWEKFLASLDSAGYSGWFAIDPIELKDPQIAATRGATLLRSLSQ